MTGYQETTMNKYLQLCAAISLCGALALAASCGGDEKDDEPKTGDEFFESLNCSSEDGKDEDKCDYALCQARSDKKDAVEECEQEEEDGDRDEDDPSCSTVGKCFDSFASCYSLKCEVGGDVSDADEEKLLECEDELNACVVGGDPEDPIDILDCDGKGKDEDLCNYNACWQIGVSEEDREECEDEDGDNCEEIYECAVDWVVCYSEACRPGTDYADRDMEAGLECNNQKEECEDEYK